jgi:Phosphatidate cytidylyltransferase, mitochondrial
MVHWTVAGKTMGGDDGEDNDDDGQLQSTESLQALLDQLPQEQICHAFAYGSGVFSQSQRTSSSSSNTTDPEAEQDEAAAAPAPPPLVDIIVVVRQAQAFHEANRLRNPSHYYTSWHRTSSSAAAKWATAVQCHDLPWLMSGYVRNPQVYFLLTDDGYKYGVVQVNHLIDDLTHWRYLYLAGRLHKPTVTIVQDNKNNEYDEDPVTVAQVLTNLPNALVTAFALLQEESSSVSATTTSATTAPSWQSATTAAASDVDVFTTIASLSYTGDPRMGLGAEDPHKVRSLVHGGHFQQNIDRWRKLYGPAMRSLEQRGLLSIGGGGGDSNQQTVEWDGAGVRRHLPRALRPPSTRGGGGWDNSNNMNHDPPVHVHHNNNNGRMIRDQLRSIVAPAARYQSLKGLFTVRPQRAFAYVLRKLAKGRSNNNNNNNNWWWWFRLRGTRPF